MNRDHNKIMNSLVSFRSLNIPSRGEQGEQQDQNLEADVCLLCSKNGKEDWAGGQEGQREYRKRRGRGRQGPHLTYIYKE